MPALNGPRDEKPVPMPEPLPEPDPNETGSCASSTSLAEALQRRGLELPAEQVVLCERYCRLLWDWNRKLNLTRHTDYDTFVSRDVVDSLELARLLAPREEVLDVGSGGGVPGVLLAVLRPDLDVSLSESVQKKARVLRAIVTALPLRVAVDACRAEHVLEDQRFDTVVARAVGPLWKILTWLQPHWASFGRLLLVKGPRWVEERAAARERGLLQRLDLRRVAAYPLAGTSSESVILQLTYRRDA
jgi:16S rRNA (guanine527-N7)-methyltransferase